MISFTCPTCGKPFRVPDEFAGRSARCKACGTTLTVPAATPATPATIASVASPAPAPLAPASPALATTATTPIPAPAPIPHQAPSPAAPSAPPPAPHPHPPARIPMRTRRLLADARHMADAFANSDLIRVLSAAGDPPDVYQVEYRVRSLEPTADPERPAPRDHHRVEIRLTADYPRVPPACKMLTPVYHPNIDPSHVCVGDHWAAGERLVDLVVRIGEMLAYQAYNIRSPLDAHAAMYADLHPDQLPTDPRTIRPAGLD